jgi:Na+/H+ antiporter NhaD/arsenite permease-like protein
MDIASISLAALLVAIVMSCTSRVHVGFLSIALAWILGVYGAGLSANEIMAGFPTRLFLTLTGVTLMFSMAQANGTLDRVAHRAVRYCRGNVGAMPMMFFLLAFVLASIGPGNIASTAIIAPMAMAVAGQVGVPAFLMAIMVGNGANAGSLSPIAPTGVIVNGIMADVGLGGYEWNTYVNNMVAHAVIVFAAYFLFGGWRLLGKRHDGAIEVPASGGSAGRVDRGAELGREHLVTLGVIAALIVGVVIFDMNVGLAAFAGAMLLTLLRVGDELSAVTIMPWRVIMMVCGVTVLIALLEETGGL